MEKPIRKRMVGRNVVISLGIICIVLVVGLFGVIFGFERQIGDSEDAALRLDRSVVWIDHKTVNETAGSSYTWDFNVPVNYAGYFSVDVQSSTDRTYVWWIWSFESSAYDGVPYGTRQVSDENLAYVGTNGTINFAILPGSNGAVQVGNNNTDTGATVTVTITYYY